MNKKTLGSSYENLAVEFLEKKKFKILDINWRYSNWGELDIVAIDPNRYGRKYLVFIEVKYRAKSMEASLRAVNYKKMRQIRKLAQLYLKCKGIDANKTAISFDLIAISKLYGQDEIRHLQNAF